MIEDWPTKRQAAAIRALEAVLAQCQREGVYLYNASGTLVAYDWGDVQAGGYAKGSGDLTKILRDLDARVRSTPVRCAMPLDAGDY